MTQIKAARTKGSFVNNLNFFARRLGRAASLQLACMARHTALIAPRIASQSDGQKYKLFPYEP